MAPVPVFTVWGTCPDCEGWFEAKPKSQLFVCIVVEPSPFCGSKDFCSPNKGCNLILKFFQTGCSWIWPAKMTLSRELRGERTTWQTTSLKEPNVSIKHFLVLLLFLEHFFAWWSHNVFIMSSGQIKNSFYNNQPFIKPAWGVMTLLAPWGC